MPYECFFKITSRLPEVEVFVVGSLNIAFSARQSLITVPMQKLPSLLFHTVSVIFRLLT